MRKQLPIADIVPIQLRAATDANYVEELAVWYIDPATRGQLPPVEIVSDGTTHWCCDGVHRLLAATEAGLTKIPCNIEQGTFQDATYRAAGANVKHGLRRTNEDKRRAVQAMLGLDELAAVRSEHGAHEALTDRQIATWCGVSHTFVANVRREKVATVATQDATADDESDVDGMVEPDPVGEPDADHQPDCGSERGPSADADRGTEAPSRLGWLGLRLDELFRIYRETFADDDGMSVNYWCIKLHEDADGRQANG